MGLLDVLNKKNIEQKQSEPTPQEVTNEDQAIEEKVRSFRMNKLNTYSTEEEQPQQQPTPQEQEYLDIYEEQGTNVIIIAPKSYDHVKTIAREIKSRKIVILKLGRVSEMDSVKIIQFVYGMCSALEVEPKLIDDTIYLIDATNAK